MADIYPFKLKNGKREPTEPDMNPTCRFRWRGSVLEQMWGSATKGIHVEDWRPVPIMAEELVPESSAAPIV